MMKIFLGVLFFLFGGSILALSDEKMEPERLTELRNFWKAASNQASQPADDGYRKQLKKIQVSLTKSGNLDGALQVKEEILRLEKSIEKSLPLEKTFTDGQSDKFIELNEKWLTSRKKVLIKIDRTYQKSLDKLMTNLSKAGDLQGALKVRKELADLAKGNVVINVRRKEKRGEDFEGTLIENTWTWTHEQDGGNRIRFFEKGKGIFGRWTNKSMTWEVIKERTVEISVEHGKGMKKTTLVWDKNLKKYQGKDFPPNEHRNVRGTIMTE